MARHSSVSRADRDTERAHNRIGSELSKMPAVKSDRWADTDRLRGVAKHHFELVARLTAENTVPSRRKLRELRDVSYDTDPAPTCKGAWDDRAAKGKASKRAAIGRDGKHQRIMKGQTARNNQAKGL